MSDDQTVKTESTRSKVFFVNGGAGRILTSIPALEKYFKKDPNAIIVCEGLDIFFKNNPILFKRTFHPMHKNLFEDYIKERDIVTTEPYRRWEYYNQKCSLAQGFDLEINGEMEEVSFYKPSIYLTSIENVKGQLVINQIKEASGKEQIIILQPFGAGIQVDGQMIFDTSGRSMEYSDTVVLIEELSKKYAVILMSEIDLQLPEGLKVGRPKANLREWASIIKAADYFVGCDSVGQHLAFAVETPSTVVLGGTYPINVSYPNTKGVTIIDLGKEKRQYSSIRIGFTEDADINNSDLMKMTDNNIYEIVNSVEKNIKKRVEILNTINALPTVQKKPFLKKLPETELQNNKDEGINK